MLVPSLLPLLRFALVLSMLPPLQFLNVLSLPLLLLLNVSFLLRVFVIQVVPQLLFTPVRLFATMIQPLIQPFNFTLALRFAR